MPTIFYEPLLSTPALIIYCFTLGFILSYTYKRIRSHMQNSGESLQSAPTANLEEKT